MNGVGSDQPTGSMSPGEPQLFAIVRARDGAVVWAAVTDSVAAEQQALIFAVNIGSVNLLSGADLANHLKEIL